MIEVLEIVGVELQKQAGGGVGEGAAPPLQCKSNIDSAGLLRFSIGVQSLGVKAEGEGLIIQLCGSVNAKEDSRQVGRSKSRSKGRSKKQKQKQKESKKQKQMQKQK